ncbi:MAG: hypothetical protein IPL61_06340 [Myxococcales bacterium]|nr:hypothetical protein [Myxococcales bacterium]
MGRSSRAWLATLAVTVACGGGGAAGDPVAEAIRRDLERSLGQPLASVRCHAGACVATTAAGLAVPVAVTGTAPVTWTTAELLDPAPIAAEVHAALRTLDADGSVDCGPLRLAADVGPVVECALADGGVAFVRIEADGTLDVELALTATIAAERRAGAADDELERTSRALDSDEAEGDDDDTDAGPADDGGLDAGLDAAGPGPGG